MFSQCPWLCVCPCVSKEILIILTHLSGDSRIRWEAAVIGDGPVVGRHDALLGEIPG